jgi:wyosine [tRNA(Phe)-imidazoG37] synthetase (radical SAM superfamily)
MYQYAELVHWFNNPSKKYIPPFVEIDLSNGCNQECFYCNSASFRKSNPGHKSVNQYMMLLSKLASWREHSPKSYGSLNAVSFPGGGEPTLLPGYEHVIEHAIDLGFLTSMTTNSSRIDRLYKNIAVEKLRKMVWIGVDIDAGDELLYERIRRSIPTESPFNKMVNDVTELVRLNIIVDFKVLLNQYNNNEDALHDIYKLAKKTGVRLVYFRPAIINGISFDFTDVASTIQSLSEKYKVRAKINSTRTEPRTYTKCHQIFQFPVFAADGEIYVCCENRGNPTFSLGSWTDGDFRDRWLSEKHLKIYDEINVAYCQPCRGNSHNNKTQSIFLNKELLESLNF